MIYIDREKEIEITEFACKQARFKDERKVQQEEMYKAFMCVLKSSVTGGQRKITAKCFENQAYLIYLFLKKKGIIVEIENDIRQDLYVNNSVNMSTTDQEKYIKDFSKIMREDKNEFIHKVCFLPSKTTLQKLLHSRMIECENEREKDWLKTSSTAIELVFLVALC